MEVSHHLPLFVYLLKCRESLVEPLKPDSNDPCADNDDDSNDCRSTPARYVPRRLALGPHVAPVYGRSICYHVRHSDTGGAFDQGSDKGVGHPRNDDLIR